MDLDPKMNVTPVSIDQEFSRLESAIDRHGKFNRLPDFQGEPVVSLSRLGCTVKIPVQLKGSRKKPSVIKGDGTSLESAVSHLIQNLNHWAEALK